MEILFAGSGKGKRVLPKTIDLDTRDGWEILEYALDEIELEIARKLISSFNGIDESNGVVTAKRKILDRFLHADASTREIRDEFVVTWTER